MATKDTRLPVVNQFLLTQLRGNSALYGPIMDIAALRPQNRGAVQR